MGFTEEEIKKMVASAQESWTAMYDLRQKQVWITVFKSALEHILRFRSEAVVEAAASAANAADIAVRRMVEFNSNIPRKL